MNLPRYEQYFKGGMYDVRISISADSWSIDIVSGDVTISFNATCKTPKSCLWVHDILMILVGTVAPLVGKPELLAELSQFVRELHKTVAESEAGEQLQL